MQSLKLPKILRRLFALSSITTVPLLLSSCAHVAIVDHEYCADIGTQGGTCAHLLTTDTRDVPKNQWDDERFGMICEKADTFADWKSVIEQLCSFSDRCDYPTQQAIESFFERADALRAKVSATRRPLP